MLCSQVHHKIISYCHLKTRHNVPFMILILNILVVLFFIAFWYLISTPWESKTSIALIIITLWLWVYNYFDTFFDIDPDDKNSEEGSTDEIYSAPKRFDQSEKEAASWKPVSNDEMAPKSKKRKFGDSTIIKPTAVDNADKPPEQPLRRPRGRPKKIPGVRPIKTKSTPEQEEQEEQVHEQEQEQEQEKQEESSPLSLIGIFRSTLMNLTGSTPSSPSEAESPAAKRQRVGNASNKTDGGNSSAQTAVAPNTTPAENRDAFQELLAPNITPKTQREARAPRRQPAARRAPRQQPPAPDLRLPNPISRGAGASGRRNDLAAYTSNPNTIPSNLRVYETDDFVIIRDLYPKATVHLLLLFKSPKNVLHPLHFFEDPEILAKTREEVQTLRHMVAKELERNFGKFSAQDKRRQQALRGEITLPDGAALPPGRDWESEVMVGLHANPSMNHVHVHILSRDRFSTFLSRRNHYQSFNTRFFVNLDELPLAADDDRWDTNKKNDMVNAEMFCWRCGRRGFKNFPDLKQHLAEEFEKWKAV